MKYFRKTAIVGGIFFSLVLLAHAANNMRIQGAGGTVYTLKTFDIGALVHVINAAIVKSDGTEIFTTANPGVVSGVGNAEGVAASGTTGALTQLHATLAEKSSTGIIEGDVVNPAGSKEGKQTILLGSVPEFMVRGSGNATGTGATIIIAASGSASYKTYVTDLECYNTSATATLVTFNDTASTVRLVPAGGGFARAFITPLVTAANTAFTFAAGTGVTTLYCNANGYKGA